MMRVFIAIAVSLCALASAAAPTNLKVPGPSHVYASDKDIATVLLRADAFMRGQMHNLMHKTSFLQKGAWATKGQENTASLFLTQPMRADSKVKLNVIEKA